MISHESQLSNDDVLSNSDNISILMILTGSLCETKDASSKQHIERMQQNTEILALSLMNLYPEYNLTEKECFIIALASAFHDIGKIQIPDYILNKPTKLTSEEFAVIKTHPVLGANLINSFIDEENRKQHLISKYAYDICLYHHERYDGKGYPYKLKGDEIPIWAQIVGLVDVYDALLHEHVYRGAYDKKEALNMIINGKCGNFNPKLIDAFKNSSLTNI